MVVTGGASGIGAALASEAAARGASMVAVVDVDIDAARATADGITARGAHAAAHRCDVSDPEQVEDLAGTLAGAHGTPAVVCVNAGVMPAGSPLLETADDDAAWVVGVNVLGAFHTLRSFGPLMVEDSEGGWLMVTGSEHSVGVPHPNAGLYTASKHAVLGMCDVLRAELPDHVGVSVVCPGLTASRLWNAAMQRPERFGGPAAADPAAGAFMDQMGMDAATVARRAFDGIAAGHFLIPTHYNARAYAQRRATDMDEAFEHLAGIDTTDYDLNATVGKYLNGLSESP